jgi:hypothetical protein
MAGRAWSWHRKPGAKQLKTKDIREAVQKELEFDPPVISVQDHRERT